MMKVQSRATGNPVTQMKPPSNINSAIFNIRRDISSVNKSKKGYNYKYADLKDCHGELDPLLEREGVVWITEPYCTDDGRAGVFYSAIHLESNSERSGKLLLPMVDGDPQKAGSAITYSRRYALAIFGILTEEDDDGKAATKKRAATKSANSSSKKFITMEESQGFLTKCRTLADSRFEVEDKANSEYLRIGKSLVSHLKIERLGAMESHMVPFANKFLEEEGLLKLG